MGWVAILLLPFGANAETVASGTGFRINDAGWTLTNRHVVEDCTQIEMEGGVRADTVLMDDTADLALVFFPTDVPVPFLVIRESGPRLAEEIAALGYPLSDLLSSGVKVTTGVVSSLAGLGDDTSYIQISTPIQPGNSGGPVIDANGLVVGVASATLSETAYDRAQNVNFAVSSGEVLAFLASSEVDFASRPDRGDYGSISRSVGIAQTATVRLNCLIGGAGVPADRPSENPSRSRDPFIILENVDLVGFDYRSIPGVGRQQCRRACLDDDRCRAFTFNTEFQHCFLKDRALLTASNPAAMGGVLREISDQVIATSFKIRSGVDSVGGDFAMFRDTNFAECFTACAAQDACRAFAHVPASGQCWLKDRLGPLSEQGGVEFGFR